MYLYNNINDNLQSISYNKLSEICNTPFPKGQRGGEAINVKAKYLAIFILTLLFFQAKSQQKQSPGIIEKSFLSPPESAKPWVIWYWMHAAISKEGITADLEAMKEVGIGGAYLMTIKDTSSAIPFAPTVRQLTPEWWAMVKFAMQEAKRLNLKLGMHVSDGFALAGGPWITPELSMQKLVWTKTYLKEGNHSPIVLDQPETNEGYYKDVAVFAYPANSSVAYNNDVLVPTVTTSNGVKASFLSFVDPDNKQSFKSDSTCWIQYYYPGTFTCRSIRIHVGGNNYQAQRLIIQSSNDGTNFTTVTRLEPPRHGWQDTDEDYTYSIPATRAKYFRFVYNKEGTEPGSEDLDAAKWKPSFKVMGIYLNDEPVINQYEAKNGSIWRIAANTTAQQVTDKNAVSLKNIINLTGKIDKEGKLDWKTPEGNWVIVRIGHTSTGHKNETAGAGKGLECDKFNATAIKLQFDSWFGKAFEKTDPSLAKEVLKIFHLDSWECGSQNWSSNFKNEFQKRRGYDLTPYLLVMTGVPVADAATSEKVLHDVRQTIAELVSDVFYKTLSGLAHGKGCTFTGETTAPTMVGDGLLHYKNVDLPMGEYWLNSPTHDKPNDMFDAISGAHIYGKNIIGAESFTSVRMNWAEHPGGLKTLGDRNFAMGINKMALHVFVHNPWMDKKPGMTLDGVGLYYQRDQTWFKQSKAWIEYLTRCQALLQLGQPVVDIAVFTGEEIPRRAVLPDRLVSTLPGIFGKERVEAEKKRLENIGQPQRQIPDGVTHSANMADPEDWVDPLNGYKYDCFNPDALMMMTVKDGRVVLPGGASYKILVIPGKHPMNPNSTLMSLAVAKKLLQLAKAGATIIFNKDFQAGIGLKDSNTELKKVLIELMKQKKIFYTPYVDSPFIKLGLNKDVEIENSDNSIAWTHRKAEDADIYFIANQKNKEQSAAVSFRVNGKRPEVWDAVTGLTITPTSWEIANGRVAVYMNLAANQSVFVIFRVKEPKNMLAYSGIIKEQIDFISDNWKLQFDKTQGSPGIAITVGKLQSWSVNTDSLIRYYSGTAVYSKTFSVDKIGQVKSMSVELDSVYNIATIKVNGIDCGTLWTYPYVADITKAIKQGENKIEIEVTNTWYNRLIGDNVLPIEKRITSTTAPFRLKDKPLQPAGLTGNIKFITR